MDGQGLFDALADSAVLLDKSGRIVNWNAGASALFGFNKKEVLGRSVNLIYDRNYPFPKLIQELQASSRKWQEDTVFTKKNGVRGHCKSNLALLPDSNESKAAALLIHQNISAFKKTENDLRSEQEKTINHLKTTLSGFWSANAMILDLLSNQEQLERKLRESELRFYLLAQNATDLISRHTPDGTFLYASPASKNAVGYESEQLLSKNIYTLVHHDDHSKLRKAFSRKREDVNYKPLVYRIKRKEGEFRWFESNIRLIIDEQTRTISEVQLASRDVTARILDKKARLRGQQLAHVFRLSTMEEMASGMAHEISQPLAALVNYTRGCVRHLENTEYDREQLKTVMEKAVSQAERAGEIVQRLKNFFCKGQLVKTRCRINNVIRETITLSKTQLTASKTKIDFNFDKNIPFIFIDKIQVQQVLLNLIQNAIEAMNNDHTKKKRIHIHTKYTRSDMIEITINDTGPGFSKEIIHNAFMPFFTTKAHGRGMGLAICRSIIETHGGQFSINPNTHNNSWIRFTLPVSI